MKPTLQFGGGIAVMALVGLLAVTLGKQFALGNEFATIVAGVIQASVTAGAIVATVWSARREADRRQQVEIRRELAEASSRRRTISSICTTAAADLKMLAQNVRTNAGLAMFEFSADLIDHHLMSIREISRDGFSPDEMRSATAIVSGLLAARRDVAAIRNSFTPSAITIDQGASFFDMLDDVVVKLPLYADICEARAIEFQGFADAVQAS